MWLAVEDFSVSVWECARPAPRTVGPNVKNPPKMRLKKFVKLTDHTCAGNDLTIFEYEDHAKTGNGSYEHADSCTKLVKSLYFWRIFSHFKPLCSANWTILNMNASDFHVWRENSRQNEGRQSDVGLLWCNLFQFVAWNLKNRSVS